jgi:hypothetical protein
VWRLIIITLVTLLVLAFIWFAFYIWGYSRPIFIYKNDFLPESKIYVRSTSIAKDLMPGDGVFIEVTRDDDTLHCNGVLCFELLKQVTNQHILIRLNLNKTDIHTQFLGVFEQFKDRRDVGFISRYPTVVSSVKEIVPGWSYGASEIEQSRLKIFEGLGLVHVPDLKCDFWVSPLKNTKNQFLTPRIVQELKRRGRAIVLDSIENMSDVELAIGLGADAVIVEGNMRDRLKSNL